MQRKFLFPVLQFYKHLISKKMVKEYYSVSNSFGLVTFNNDSIRYIIKHTCEIKDNNTTLYIQGGVTK
jgi:hypothetical protein